MGIPWWGWAAASSLIGEFFAVGYDKGEHPAIGNLEPAAMQCMQNIYLGIAEIAEKDERDGMAKKRCSQAGYLSYEWTGTPP
jgi:hypothetical protein